MLFFFLSPTVVKVDIRYTYLRQGASFSSSSSSFHEVSSFPLHFPSLGPLTPAFIFGRKRQKSTPGDDELRKASTGVIWREVTLRMLR